MYCESEEKLQRIKNKQLKDEKYKKEYSESRKYF